MRERRWVLLALAQYRCGRQAEALASLRQVRTVLTRELGLDPGEDLVDLEQAILRQDPSLATDAVWIESSPRCPYHGLVPYDVDDSDGFFGREADVATCLRRLSDVGAVVVVGPSGSGKSSLVRAGIAAALRSAGTRVQVITPGVHPMDALTSVHRAQVLVVDQCEEAVTLCTDAAESGAFFDALATHRQLVVALRADRMDGVAGHPGFARVVEKALHLLNPMGADDLRACIQGPAQQAGLLLEPGLVDLLLREVEGEPGALPLLSHALRETWAHRQGRTLTVEGYQATGGIRGAVARTADEVFSGLDPDQQRVTRDLMLRLVATGSAGEPVRRRVPRRLLASDLQHEQLVERLIAARLVTSDEGSLQIAHEALARAWPRLHDWLTEDAQGQQVRDHLSTSADAWDAMGQPESELYRGVRLAQALDWRDQSAPELTTTEREFLDASRRQVDGELRAAREQAEREATALHRTRRLAIGLAAMLVLALVAAGLAVSQWSTANQERSVATARELVSAAEASLTEDPERSILLALAALNEAGSGDPTVLTEATNALHRAVTTSRMVLSVPGLGGALDWSPGGNVFVTEGPEDSGIVDIRDATTGRSLRSFQGHDIDINDVAFSQDGSMLATSGDDGAVRVWDPKTGNKVMEYRLGRDVGVWCVSFSPDGSLVATCWAPLHQVRVLDVATGREVARIRTATPLGAAFSPNGRRIAVVGQNGTGEVVSAATGKKLFSLPSGNESTFDAGWSPDGRWIATAGNPTVRIFDAATGKQRFTIADHTTRVYGLDWSPDSTRLASVSEDGTALVSEISHSGVIERFSFSAQDTSHGLFGVAFSPDADRLMTGDIAMTAVKIWDVTPTGGAEWANVSAASGGPVGFTPRGDLVAESPDARSAVVWNSETAEQRATIPATATPVGFDLSEDGHLLATSGQTGPVEVWDLTTQTQRFSAPVASGGDTPVEGLSWSGDGDVLAVIASGDDHGDVLILDPSGTRIGSIPEKSGQFVTTASFDHEGNLLATTSLGPRMTPKDANTIIWDWRHHRIVSTIDTFARLATFDPSGNRLATTRWVEGKVEIWDARTGKKLATIATPALVSAIAFSPDGDTLATGNEDGTITLWDTETGVQEMLLRASRTVIDDVAFSQDGAKLASNGPDGIVRVWALEIDDLVAIAHERLRRTHRTMSDSECRQYLHADNCPDT